MTEIQRTTDGYVRYEQSNDKAIDTNDEEIPAPVQKLRRRSSFFAEARRRSFGNTLLNDSCNPQFPENTDINAYKDLLDKEEKAWKYMIRRRKDEYRETERIYSDFCKERHVMTEEEGWSLLDDDQKRYLSTLPNFSNIESRCNYNLHLVMLLQNQERTNKITLKKVLEKAEDNIEGCKAKIQQYATRN